MIFLYFEGGSEAAMPDVSSIIISALTAVFVPITFAPLARQHQWKHIPQLLQSPDPLLSIWYGLHCWFTSKGRFTLLLKHFSHPVTKQWFQGAIIFMNRWKRIRKILNGLRTKGVLCFINWNFCSFDVTGQCQIICWKWKIIPKWTNVCSQFEALLKKNKKTISVVGGDVGETIGHKPKYCSYS